MNLLRRFLGDTTGATILEFAMVAPLFFLMLFAIVEFGLIHFSQVAVEAAVTQASRSASLGLQTSGGDRVTTVRQLVRDKTFGLIGRDDVTISAAVVGQGTTHPPDICLTTPPSMPATCPYPPGHQENNGIPGYQPPGPVSLGNPGDMVEIRVSYPWRVQVPGARYLFGENGLVMISSATIIKNEPF